MSSTPSAFTNLSLHYFSASSPYSGEGSDHASTWEVPPGEFAHLTLESSTGSDPSRQVAPHEEPQYAQPNAQMGPVPAAPLLQVYGGSPQGSLNQSKCFSHIFMLCCTSGYLEYQYGSTVFSWMQLIKSSFQISGRFHLPVPFLMVCPLLAHKGFCQNPILLLLTMRPRPARCCRFGQVK